MYSFFLPKRAEIRTRRVFASRKRFGESFLAKSGEAKAEPEVCKAKPKQTVAPVDHQKESTQKCTLSFCPKGRRFELEEFLRQENDSGNRFFKNIVQFQKSYCIIILNGLQICFKSQQVKTGEEKIYENYIYGSRQYCFCKECYR